VEPVTELMELVLAPASSNATRVSIELNLKNRERE